MKALDLVGQRFGRLVVIKRVDGYTTPNGKKRSKWLCQCDCGNTKEVLGSSLKNGHTKSCGCIHDEKTAERCYKHGLRQSRIYYIWCDMKSRCNCPTKLRYYNYGGRGIKVCEEWNNDFMSFYNWAINNGYSDDLTIDRIDVNGHYEPHNCRWADNKVQSNNKRNNRYLTLGNETHTMAEWAEITGISNSVILYRIKSGWSLEQTLMTPTPSTNMEKIKNMQKRFMQAKREVPNDSNIQELQSVKPNDS